MAKDITSPYHLSSQSAVALLRPVEATLAELEARLNQYVERIPMSDSDREKVATARKIVAEDRARIAEIVQADRTGATAS